VPLAPIQILIWTKTVFPICSYRPAADTFAKEPARAVTTGA
jgi:hypothetical protein